MQLPLWQCSCTKVASAVSYRGVLAFWGILGIREHCSLVLGNAQQLSYIAGTSPQWPMKADWILEGIRFWWPLLPLNTPFPRPDPPSFLIITAPFCLLTPAPPYPYPPAPVLLAYLSQQIFGCPLANGRSAKPFMSSTDCWIQIFIRMSPRFLCVQRATGLKVCSKNLFKG